jgi:hypothetical protein
MRAKRRDIARPATEIAAAWVRLFGLRGATALGSADKLRRC